MVGVVQGGDGGLSRGTAETVAAVEVSNSVLSAAPVSGLGGSEVSVVSTAGEASWGVGGEGRSRGPG
jgi:hypothetical protein